MRAEKAWEECRRQGEAAERELGELRAAHTDSDALLERIVAARAVQQRLAAEAEALAPLPEGYADAERFLREYREREQGLGALQESLDAARREYYQAEADQPEAASEETRELKEEAERAWAAVRRRGRALERILLAVDELLAEQDGNEGNGYGEEMARHVGRMTGGRYRRVRMAGALPDALLRGDETPLAYELLSGGTKDVFSLGLRLAMAGWFLQGKEGFLVMDDPLVELDPGRQRLAAEALAGFCGEGRQLVLFTCHPSHAALFDGANRIELG